MPEELQADIKALSEQAEPEKTEEKTEEEYQWTIRDDVNIVGIIIFMYAILAGLFYIAVTLYRQTDNSSVCSQQTRQISP